LIFERRASQAAEVHEELVYVLTLNPKPLVFGGFSGCEDSFEEVLQLLVFLGLQSFQT
jgi:hypothetical protein